MGLSTMFKTEKICTVCHKNSDFIEDCPGCNIAWYCSKQCAKKDKNHEKICFFKKDLTEYLAFYDSLIRNKNRQETL